jgi:hypothetical protein
MGLGNKLLQKFIRVLQSNLGSEAQKKLVMLPLLRTMKQGKG